jgi:hypothetical protein
VWEIDEGACCTRGVVAMNKRTGLGDETKAEFLRQRTAKTLEDEPMGRSRNVLKFEPVESGLRCVAGFDDDFNRPGRRDRTGSK